MELLLCFRTELALEPLASMDASIYNQHLIIAMSLNKGLLFFRYIKECLHEF